MKYAIIHKIILTAFLMVCISSFAEPILLSKNAKISVLTCETGNEIYSIFGHTAIRVADVSNKIDIVYNYGTFDFNTTNFSLKFTKGTLIYFATACYFTDFIAEYNYDRRSVYEQELNISESEKQELFNNLNSAILLENREYLYKFIHKNCTSMTIDILNRTLKDKIIAKNKNVKLPSYRAILYPYFENHFYEKLGVNIVFGKDTDELCNNIFLPIQLKDNLKTISYKNKPLVIRENTLVNFKKEKATPLWWNSIYTYLFALSIFILIDKKSVANSYYIIIGILGTLFLFLCFYSSHQELKYNYNLLLFNPTILFLFYFSFIKNPKWSKILIWFNLATLSIYTLVLVNKIHLLILLPLICTQYVVLIRHLKRLEKSHF